MTTEQQEVWLRAAIDALQGIRVVEVRAIMLELQRTVQRPNQIVPEIARLVAEKRKRPTANAGLDAINAERRRTGAGEVRWVKRDGHMACELVDAPESSLGKRVK